MALTASTIWEVQTGGSDTANGGAFDPSQTAGMFTDGASTSSSSATPNFSSVSYTFVSGDIGAWIYIASGTNWIAGWYKITAISGSAATLNAAIGAAVLKTVLTPNTVQGVGATASATWTIDYSQQAGTRYAFTYADLVSAGAGLTVSSAAQPFGKEQVGNSIVITGGTNFNTGRYVIASVGASPTFIATVVGPTNITSGVGALGTGGQGGALASPGIIGGILISGNNIFIKSGSYSITSASTNIAAGCFSAAATASIICGYNSIRRDMGTAPVFTATGSISTFTVFNCTGNDSAVQNITVDCSIYTASKAFVMARSNAFKLFAKNCTNGGITNTNGVCLFCSATGCTTVVAISTIAAIFCEAYSNTFTGINSRQAIGCLSYANSGSTSDGFTNNNTALFYINCVAYNNGRHGFNNTVGSGGFTIYYINCIAEGHAAAGGIGFTVGSSVSIELINCASYNNNTADSNGGGLKYGMVTLTASPFISAAGGNFALNNTSGAGASCRKAGFPGTFPAGTSVGYLDIGAIQAQWPLFPLNISNAI